MDDHGKQRAQHLDGYVHQDQLDSQGSSGKVRHEEEAEVLRTVEGGETNDHQAEYYGDMHRAMTKRLEQRTDNLS